MLIMESATVRGPGRPAPLLAIALGLLLGAGGCLEEVDQGVTGLRVDVSLPSGVAITQLRFDIFVERDLYQQTVIRPEVAGKPLAPGGESLVFIFPDDLAGEVIGIRVDGLDQQRVIASAASEATLVLGEVVTADIALQAPAACGDGVFQPFYEECDDGGLEPGDGCSAVCLIEPGWTCDRASPTRCYKCGDGTCDPGEDLCGCPADCGAAKCGDGFCCQRGGESGCSCPEDCGPGVCGDGICCLADGESTCACQQDCGQEFCGNQVCCPGTGESAASCPVDCATGCGDGACLGAENACTCPADCGQVTCGDDVCCPEEDSCVCPDDCGSGSCGDGICCAADGEDACSCAADCGGEPCGDGICCNALGENVCTCPADCGQTMCGDAVCCEQAGEDPASCSDDCLAQCPDGRCTGGEDACSCPQDCPGVATCGDGSCCAPMEDACACPLDCGASTCGDGVCCAADGENRCSCPDDCGTSACGDGLCCPATGEDRCTCEADCGSGACGDGICCARTGENGCSCSDDCPGGSCGDGLCCPVAGENRCACPDDCGPGACGDGYCCPADGEDVCTCGQDCGQPTCGDGVCCPGNEDTCTCPPDCGQGTCGDGVCCADSGEDPASCELDCGAVCPDGTCSPSEDPCACPADCPGATCGDGICCAATGEDACACPADCPGGLCGDGTCCPQAGEDACGCPLDCGPSTCGDGTCCPAEGEDACACPDDCGAGECGDGVCCPGEAEDACGCPQDCPGGACGDGICCPAGGEDADDCPEDCGGGCPNLAAGLWLSTAADVSGSGVAGLDGWAAGDALSLAQPGLTMEPGTTGGSLQVAFSLDALAADGDADIDGLHVVGRDLTLATEPPFSLQAGDLLFSTSGPEVLGAAQVPTSGDDVMLFRPDQPGDYSTGTVQILLDGSAFIDTGLVALTLVEADTWLADVALPAGALIFAQDGNNESKYLYLFVPGAVGPGTTAGDRSVLIRYLEVGLPNKLAASGVDLLEACAVLGDESPAGAQLLLSMPAATSPFGIDGTAQPRDAFLLRLTSTTAGSGLTSGTARLLFEGADLGLDSAGEDLSGLCVVAP